MNIFKRLFYNLQYLGTPPWDTGKSPPELLDFIHSREPGRALDLGCGTGTNVITLAQQGWQVVGVDFISRPIQIARKKAQQAGVQAEFYVDDVTRLEGIEGPFDLILDMGCFHSLDDEGMVTYVQKVRSLLAPTGTFMLYGFTARPHKLERGITPDEQRMIESHLQLIHFKPGTDRDEGKMHSAWFWFQKEQP